MNKLEIINSSSIKNKKLILNLKLLQENLIVTNFY